RAIRQRHRVRHQRGRLDRDGCRGDGVCLLGECRREGGGQQACEEEVAGPREAGSGGLPGNQLFHMVITKSSPGDHDDEIVAIGLIKVKLSLKMTGKFSLPYPVPLALSSTRA